MKYNPSTCLLPVPGRASDRTTTAAQASRRIDASAEDHARFMAVKAFADSVLARGRDRYGPEHTPLFADGLHVDTGEPVRWIHDGKSQIISNMVSQQNLFRVLAGLTAPTSALR